ncbi:hypothetical protein E3E35_01535 [Thermococcus sp. GR7]|uniref:hypothetical protein n=1 Tax=Thermococcus TaxID=2263 RepID=UPI00064E98C7|nr:hypothetical protein [Thermococcus onnurineus]NJE46112.1 hypothetical protein [Thermococcus sp. GR7]NJE78252.1 hypothetical protein [Thermococcus sp. GR4]NJF22309.1 hypothetical protein [Thermococcus sp. GR5]
MDECLAVFLVVLLVLSAGCVETKFVYIKAKFLGSGETLEYVFAGPSNLTVKIDSNIPADVKILSNDGEVLTDFGETQRIDMVIELPKGKWKLIIHNPGNKKAVLNIWH